MKSRVEKSRGAEEITHCCLYFVVVVVAVAFSRGKFLPQIILTLPLKLPHRPVRCYWYLMLCLLVCFLFRLFNVRPSPGRTPEKIGGRAAEREAGEPVRF